MLVVELVVGVGVEEDASERLRGCGGAGVRRLAGEEREAEAERREGHVTAVKRVNR